MKAWGIRISVAMAMLAIALVVDAASPQALRKQMELSMVVTGSVDIDVDGRVEHYALDKPDKLPPGIAKLVSMNLPVWKFAPKIVDGKPVAIHSNMSLRFVASPKGDGSHDIGIRSAFFAGSDVGENRVSVAKKPSLGMLEAAMGTAGAAGDVYVALKIGPDGRVMDGVVEQVNLATVGTDVQMKYARHVLGERSLDFARNCRFAIPAKSRESGKAYWTGVLPFRFSFEASEGYGSWHAYLPGPRANIPWRSKDDGTSRTGVDAMPDGGLTLDDAGPKLLTPLMQG